MKIVRGLVGLLAFLIMLIFIYFIHISYLKVDVVFYAAIVDVVFAAAIAGVLLFTHPYFHPLGHFEKSQLVLIWLLAGYALAISVPTVLDRSLSFYILEKIQQRGGGIRQEAFEQVFTEEYMREHRLVDVRLTEQLASGTIRIHNGCVLLTAKGAQLAEFSRSFRRHFLPKKRLLMGQYTDTLTDPFRFSEQRNQYVCDGQQSAPNEIK